MTETVRYRPGEALRWLETSAVTQRKSAYDKGKAALTHADQLHMNGLKSTVLNATGALVDLGKGAYSDLVRRRADAAGYLLSEESFSLVGGPSSRTYQYADVSSITWKNDRAVLTVGQTELVIKPYAYIVAGRAKAPVGWERNGMEVPYELLIEELAARARVDIRTS